MPKPEILIEHLRGLTIDPSASRHFEMMSGGFLSGQTKSRRATRTWLGIMHYGFYSVIARR